MLPTRHRHIGALIGLILLVVAVRPLWISAHGAGPAALAAHTAYLPAISKGGAQAPVPPPPPPPPAGGVPAALAASWFTGAIPPSDFYNPATGEWRATNGLGQMYTFEAGGAFTYAGFLRIQNGACLTEVSVFKQGSARAAGNALTLTPTLWKTRTMVICGSRTDTTTNGSLAPYQIGWSVAEDASGHTELRIAEGGQTTTYLRQGMAAQLVGAWQRGGVRSANFYDAATQQFAPQSDAGAWFRFNADGTYSYGEFGYGTNPQGCQLKGWIYQQGTLSVSGSALTTTPTSGVARVESSCSPGQPQQQPYLEDPTSYTWLFRDKATAPKLVLIPLSVYSEYIFLPE